MRAAAVRLGERPVHRGLVAGRAPRGQLGDLGALDLGADAEDLKLAADGLRVGRHADDALVALLQLLLVLEGGVGDLAGEPAGLDAAQDAAGHRAVRGHGTDAGEELLGFRR